ncbi:MAG: copper chaperone PCu(A)C [Hyphomonadaceae bacterium JAD_PAG50586_4]|nr:MAG: copper chaperone PCu(A)C [Hyphomonadaceae bacterium JAD_PAG50586_4]
MLEVLAAGLKAILYAAALCSAGAALARASLSGAWSGAAAPMQAIARWAGAALAVSACMSAFLFVVRLGNYWDIATLGAIFLSPLGLALSLHFVAGVWFASGTSRLAGGVAALAIIIAFAVSGHAAAKSAPLALLMALHVSAAAWWVGGLWLLLRAARAQGGSDFAKVVACFSTQALWIIGALAITGAATAVWLLEFSFDPTRDYDRGLALKVALVVALLAAAAYNKFVLTPGLVHKLSAQPTLRRSIIGEMSLIACILAATASLTTFTSPHHAPTAVAEAIAVSGPIDIINPWAASTPGGVTTGGGYLSIINNQEEVDSLIGASSPRARRVSLHEMHMDGAIMRMRELAELEIASGERLDLTSGYYHLMFEDIDAPFVEGETVVVTLTFRVRGEVEVEFPVRRGAGHSH